MLANKQAKIPDNPVLLQERAADNLRFIRATMESASYFTGLSGKGFVLAGCTVPVTVYLAESQASSTAWLLVWLAELLLAAPLLLLLSAHKAKRQGTSLWSHAGRQLLMAFTPPMIAGGLFTLALFMQGRLELAEGVWLTLYGAGVMTGGLFSIRLIPLMGAAFMLLGSIALLLPTTGALMAVLGFGGVHILFGAIIWRSHGG